MRSKSSSKQNRISRVNLSMEKHKIDKVKEEPHLSGAYIRSLVKHLTSTKTKDSFNGDENLPETLNTNEERCTNDHNNMHPQSPPPEPSPQPKKQVRRRQLTSKPYKERLLNMAEARKEIVTALKFHRASMRQQESANKHEPQLEQPSLGLEEKSKIKSRKNPRAYPSTTTSATRTPNLSNNYLNHHPSLSCPPSIPYYWPISTISPPHSPPLYHANLNPTLPNQTLGLNLNFQDFKNLDASLYHNSLSNYSTSSSSSSSSCSCSCSSSAAVSATEEVVTNSTTTSSSGGNDLHQAMDDEEIQEIISLGERHQMEWNDTMNLVISARWFDYLKSIETGPDDDSTYNQIMEFPPYMDIGEIEGMDWEWLA